MRRGFGFHDRHSPFRFDPATLFIGGAIEGAFYDSSNITTLFQDDAGTTPVTAVEQTVGRILDLSGNGNHATQSVAGSRPTYRARYNMLTYSEEFDQGVWTKQSATVAANNATAPDGTNTAETVTATAGSFTATVISPLITVIPSTNYTYSIYLKAGTATTVRLRLSDAATGQTQADINLSTGAISIVVAGPYGSPSVSSVSAGNGWWRASITGTQPAGQTNIRCGFYIPNNGETVIPWGAQLLSAADQAATGNAYQRIGAATDYTTGDTFRPYLALDGSNDSMVTSAIDFTGTDKMTVWAGVTKSSDAAQGVVAELSATIASNNGAFLLSAPNSAAANYNWSSKGTTQVDNTVTTYAAPNTAVLTGQANIAGPSNIIRVNGAQAGSVATTQGTGNFGNYPLYIGRRNDASLPFNGRLYGLIVLGAAASSWQVQVTERWMASKTGLQF